MKGPLPPTIDSILDPPLPKEPWWDEKKKTLIFGPIFFGLLFLMIFLA